MYLCLKKLFPPTKKSDFVKVLDFIESNTQDSAPSGPHDEVKINALQVGMNVNYDKFLSLLVKLNKHFKFGETKAPKTNDKNEKNEKNSFNLTNNTTNTVSDH